MIAREEYERLKRDEEVRIPDVRGKLERGDPLVVELVSTGRRVDARHDLTRRGRDTLVAGGMVNLVRNAAGVESRAPESR